MVITVDGSSKWLISLEIIKLINYYHNNIIIDTFPKTPLGDFPRPPYTTTTPYHLYYQKI